MKTTLLILASLTLAAGLASASVTFTVTGNFTSGGTGDVLTASGGDDTFTLTWSDSSPTTTISAPSSNITYGQFALACTLGCDGDAVTIPAFTFVVTVDDSTDGGTGTFTGSSSGGTVTYNSTGPVGSSNVNISWLPASLGPGTSNLTAGTTFGPTEFQISSPILIDDPTQNGGVSTISGLFTTSIQEGSTPEPATLGLVGGALLGLGLLRKKFVR